MPSDPLSPSPASIRRRGLIRFVIALAVFAAGLTVPLFVLPHFHLQFTPFGMIPFALPGAYALAGFIELVTGVPFTEFARRWDELKGWQRGIFGTIIVLVALVVIFATMGMIASRF